MRLSQAERDKLVDFGFDNLALYGLEDLYSDILGQAIDREVKDLLHKSDTGVLNEEEYKKVQYYIRGSGA